MAWSVVTGTISGEKLCAAYSVCAVCGMAGFAGSHKGCSESKPGTHRDERIIAARLDRDATRVKEPGAAAGAVEVASGAAAGERGGRPGGDFDTADPLVASVLRCIMEGHTE